MFAHCTQGSNNLPLSAQFYDALLKPLGIERRDEINEEVICYVCTSGNAARFFLVAPFNNQKATAGNGSMIAFSATNKEQVDQSYRSGINHGGIGEGAPGNRPNYAEGYYGAYLRDLDGNKVHIVFRGDLLA